MSKSITKVARGVAFGDVANSAIRNILTEISKRYYNPIDENYINEMRAFFNNKCPYTGADLSDLEKQERLATDHIIPQNWRDCGLNVPGNLILCDKDANKIKHMLSLEDFLLRDVKKFFTNVPASVRKSRYDKIKDFQKKYNYDGDKVKKLISHDLQQIYSQIIKQQEGYIDEIVSVLNESNDKGYEFIPDVNRKIGDIVRHEFFDLLMSGKVPKEEIERLQLPEYSNQIFGITTFPVLSKTKIYAKGERSYTKPILIYGEEYYVCNDWHEKSRDRLIDYINKYY